MQSLPHACTRCCVPECTSLFSGGVFGVGRRYRELQGKMRGRVLLLYFRILTFKKEQCPDMWFTPRPSRLSGRLRHKGHQFKPNLGNLARPCVKGRVAGVILPRKRERERRRVGGREKGGKEEGKGEPGCNSAF